ncbi:UNVERIFIED_CONTAM: hypothetical protein GTU68_003572 [Idotea baltica]|nr:hypothetical protein [Idotea baltica]
MSPVFFANSTTATWTGVTERSTQKLPSGNAASKQRRVCCVARA